MSSTAEFRGVFYSIKPAGEQRWQWQITPPTCVKGLREESGEIDGAQSDAVQAARRAIDRQVGIQ